MRENVDGDRVLTVNFKKGASKTVNRMKKTFQQSNDFHPTASTFPTMMQFHFSGSRLFHVILRFGARSGQNSDLLFFSTTCREFTEEKYLPNVSSKFVYIMSRFFTSLCIFFSFTVDSF